VTTLMRKTKQELAALVSEMEAKIKELDPGSAGKQPMDGDQKARLDALQNELDDLKDSHETLGRRYQEALESNADLRNQIDALKARHASLEERFVRAEELKAGLRESLDDALEEKKQITRKYEQVLLEKTRLIAQLTALQEDHAEIVRRLETCEAGYNTHYELFRSFVEDDTEKVLLIDSSYCVRYVNSAAAAYLGTSEGAPLIGARVFDFMSYKDALKLKEKIDTAFLEGSSEKAKKIEFRAGEIPPVKLKMKIHRVRYQDQPSIKIIIK